MFRTGLVFLCVALFACHDKKQKVDEGEFSFEKFSEHFKKLALPYQMSDTGLLKNRDTTSIRIANFGNFVPDSLKNLLFGKASKVKYTALGFFTTPEKLSFYLVKAQSGARRAALLLAFNRDQFGGVFTFLVPDNDPSTSQISMIDKSLTVQKNVTQKKSGIQTGEGKDVYEYDVADKKFALILTNPLNSISSVINPIDTFPRKHKFSGDYVKDRKNYISVRDGRYANQLLVYIHLDKNSGGCTGELKGDMLLTSGTTAIYRQGGDPCVLTLRFTSSSVTVREDEGCGSHRGLDCLFNGTFSRKKETKTKSSTKKK